MATAPTTHVWTCCVHSDVFNFSPPGRHALLEELEVIHGAPLAVIGLIIIFYLQHLEFRLVDVSAAQIMFYDPRAGTPVAHYGSGLKLVDYHWVEETLRAQEWALFEDWTYVPGSDV